MGCTLPPTASATRRAPHGARGLKSSDAGAEIEVLGRAPHGARGLKWLQGRNRHLHLQSRPARGAWIEIDVENLIFTRIFVAPRTGRVD